MSKDIRKELIMKKFIAPVLTGLLLVGAASAAGKSAPKSRFNACLDSRSAKCHAKHTPPRHIICPLGSRSSGCSSNGHILSSK
jgi:hypothetical protein